MKIIQHALNKSEPSDCSRWTQYRKRQTKTQEGRRQKLIHTPHLSKTFSSPADIKRGDDKATVQNADQVGDGCAVPQKSAVADATLQKSGLLTLSLNFVHSLKSLLAIT